MDRSGGGERTRGGNNGSRSETLMTKKDRVAAQKVAEEQKAAMKRVSEAMKKRVTVGDIQPFVTDVVKGMQDLATRQETLMLAMKYLDPTFPDKFNEAERRIRQLREKLQEIESSDKGLDWLRQQVLLWNSDERNKHIVAPMFDEQWLLANFSPDSPGAQTLPLDERVKFATEFGLHEMFINQIMLAPIETKETVANPEGDVLQFPTQIDGEVFEDTTGEDGDGVSFEPPAN